VTLVLIAPAGSVSSFAAATTAQSRTASTAAKRNFIYITPGPIGANEFLQLGAVGTREAARKFNATAKVVQAQENPTSWEQNLRTAINAKPTIIILIGFEFNDALTKLAPQNPNQQFLIIDQCLDKPPANVHCARFKEYEVNYLLGVAAGKLTKSNRIGALGALDIPFLHRYTDAFVEGAKHVNHSIQADVRWIATDTSGFSDPAKAKQQALAMAAQGDDQILAAASASNLGVFQAAQQKNFDAYGVDVNQCPSAPGHVVDNAVKRVDVVTVKAIGNILHQTGAQITQYGLKSGGLTLTTLSAKNPLATKCLLAKHPSIIKLIKKVRQQIISGKIKIKDPMQSG
jgi:basic membrane protein A